MNAIAIETAREPDRRGNVITVTMVALILLGALLMLLAPSASRAALVVRAEVGPVRVIYSDAQPACARVAPPRPIVSECMMPPRPAAPRHVCRLSHRHSHRYVWVPDRWVRVDGHRVRHAEGHFLCKAKPHKHGQRGGVVIVRDGRGRGDD